MTRARFKAVSDCGVLVELGDQISDKTNAQIWALDKAIQDNPPSGFLEAIPAYTSILAIFDPLTTDHQSITAAIKPLLKKKIDDAMIATKRHVKVCYDDSLAPDLTAICKQTGLSKNEVINAHLKGEFRVAMYGFAPGYAYLSGLAMNLQLPRKERPIRDVPAGSVIIAGQQCIVTTLKMPTGWWRIGMSPTPILSTDRVSPFLFDLGDEVVFERIGLDDYMLLSAAVKR